MQEDRITQAAKVPGFIERFWAKITKTDGCWEWTGYKDRDGYGRLCLFKLSGRPRALTHRIAYTLARGSVPDGMCVLHRCDNPPCCNPEHLFLGTNTENQADKVAKARQCVGEASGAAKLTEASVKEIRLLAGTGLRQKDIAAMFGITQPNVGYIVRRETWTHI